MPGHVSISTISAGLALSIPTVTKMVNELLEEGFLQEDGKVDTTGGRRPMSYGLNPDAGYFVGVDVTRQHINLAICNFKGELIKFIQDIDFVLVANPESFSTICSTIRNEVSSTGIPWGKVLSVGVSLSGRVNPEMGYSLSYFVSDDIPIKQFMQNELQVSVLIENDSRAMAYGEYVTMGETDKDMIFVNLSWGLGMGMILNGELYYGKSGYSGEIGHFPMPNNDRICRCGKIGCLETGASGSALQRILIEKLRDGRKSSLSGIYDKKRTLTLKEILTAVENEDVLAIEGIEEVGSTLGQGLAGVINIFNPSLVVIGGRLIVGKDYLMLPLKSAVNKYSISKVSSDTRFKFSILGRKAASVGDCLLCRSKLLGLL